MFNLGGLLVARLDPPDLTGARHWLEKAAQVGDSEAMNKLRKVKSRLPFWRR
jgi:TPR repeat protein